MSTPWTLIGKRALITGGTRGIGSATADEFLALGAEVAIVSRKRAERAGVRTIQADVSDPSDRARIAIELGAHWDRLDVLVNNAGMNIRKPWAEIRDEERDMVLNTNALGPMDLTKRLLPLLRKSTAASVVNVASVAGFVDVGSGATYALSKAALLQFTRSIAVEWAPLNIRVNAVAPWYIRTPLTEPVLSQAERMERILSRTPTMAEATYQRLVARLEAQGYETSRLVQTPQVAGPPPAGDPSSPETR